MNNISRIDQVSAADAGHPSHPAAGTPSLASVPGYFVRRSVAAVLWACATFNPQVWADTPREMRLPAGDLLMALDALAKQQTDTQLIYRRDQLQGIRTKGVSGTLTTQEAILKLLDGTALRLSTDAETGAMLIAPSAKTDDSTAQWDRASQDPSPAIRLSQSANQGNRAEEPENEGNRDEARDAREVGIEEVLVTGSLIPIAAESAQAVRVYDHEKIQKSGQATVAGFLNSLPSVSVARPEGLIQTSVSQATVSLRGLPVGTTLVLINGQRAETSGTLTRQGAFDLNNIPIDAVENVEVLATGTSIYGSDAIAGVINIILKKNYDGLHLSARYGSADDTDESSASLSWGNRWRRGSLSVTGTYQARSELRAAERELLATNDYRKYGGSDSNFPFCHPGNVWFPNGFSFNGGAPVQFAAVPAGLTGSPTAADYAATAGTLNTCSIVANAFTVIPETRRAGLLVSGEYDLGHSLSLFSDLLYSRAEQRDMDTGSAITGFPFVDIIVPATNPYNPFGTDVGISYAFPNSPHTEDATTDFARALLGAKGRFGDDWAWELSYIHLQDWTDNPSTTYGYNLPEIQAAANSSDPATAFNPFIDGSPGSPELVRTFFTDALFKHEGRRQALNGLVRGQVLNLPAGAVQLAFGSEYARELIHGESVAIVGDPSTALSRTDSRETTAVFAEARIPLLSARQRVGDVLALTLAARYDDYSDFGSTTNPQFAVEWRPLDSLLVRGSYVESFRVPTLQLLHDPVRVTPRDNVVIDRTTGQQVLVSSILGGGTELEPEVGHSETFGVVYYSKAIPGLQLSFTHWKVEQEDTIQSLSEQSIIDNEATFPSRVIRNAAGVIESVDARLLNFGGIAVAGLDYDLNYRRATSMGTWSGSVSATQIYDYDVQLVPGAPSRSNVSKADETGNWAPRWKGAATVGWARGPYSASFTGRYVSSYKDYNSTREIGNFWLYDVHLRYGLERTSESAILKGSYLELGAVNLFDSLPQWSTYSPFYGIDPAQSDIRGRYLYLQVGAHL